VLVSFEITMGDNRGIMNLCIPFNTIEPLSGKLSSDTWSAYRKRGSEIRHKLNLEANMSQARVELTVNLAKTKLATEDLMSLSVGDVIVTETDRSAGVEVLVESRPLFRGTPGVLKGRKAVKIGQRIARLQDVVASQLQAADVSQPAQA
jgi:flagellar motor switch protein FliM